MASPQSPSIFPTRTAAPRAASARPPAGGNGLHGGGPLDVRLAAARAQVARAALQPLQLIGLADELAAAGRSADVIALYEHWLGHCSSAVDHVVQFNLGVALSQAERLADAEKAYRAALARDPRFPQAAFNLGTIVERLGRAEEALAIWQGLLDRGVVDPDASRELYVLTCNNLGRLREQTRDFAGGEAALRESLRVDPAQPKAIQHWVHLRQKQCAWPVYAELPGVTPGELVSGTSPLAMLSATDDPGLQLATALRFVRERVNVRVPALAPARGYAHPKLRIGFLSSDFCLHAVSLLTVELFELLDRERFEVHGFCWSREDGSPLRARVIAAMDRFTRIGALDDAAAARAIRDAEIDVLVDLHGLTSGARPAILAYRPAPVQMTYLGFPGTTGLPGVDYVIADRFLIPDAEAPYYSEQPLYLPDVFQCSDRQRAVGQTPSRAACGLPEGAFVFCSFNNSYKVTPEQFAAWLRILKCAPESVLWLLGDNPWAEANLRRAASEQGVDPARLVFAGRVAPPDYLARYRAADLFLDAYPFNGGTTANDALWMGLPLLTRSGRTFASRMAGSLLTALDLPELITDSLAAYEARAIEIATQPGVAAALKRKLAEAREKSPLFDMPRFVRGFEQAVASKALRG